jgi:hypothetical protein
MKDLGAFSRHLQEVNQSLVKSPLFTGSPSDSKKAEEEAVRLETFKDEVHIIIRELTNSENFLSVRRGNVRKLPRDERFAAEHALKQQIANIARVKQDAIDLAETIARILDKNGPGSANWMRSAGEWAEDAVNEMQAGAHPELKTEIEHAMLKGANLVPASELSSDPNYSVVVPVVVFICLGLDRLVKKLRSKNKK